MGATWSWTFAIWGQPRNLVLCVELRRSWNLSCFICRILPAAIMVEHLANQRLPHRMCRAHAIAHGSAVGFCSKDPRDTGKGLHHPHHLSRAGCMLTSVVLHSKGHVRRC